MLAGAAPMYDFAGQNGLPAHMAQFGYSTASPRPGSAYGPPTYDDGFSHVDGEFYDPDTESEFFNTDQNLIQEWPFGHKTGVEGKSTITYSPQQQMRGLNPASAGMFASALRGQSIQYGAGYPALVPPQQAASQLPGPGYFSQNSPLIQPTALQTQANMIQGQFGMATKPGAVPAMSPAMQPAMSPAMQPRPAPAPVTTSKPAAPMMPPNAVIAGQTSEAKPTLIPGSVGIPAATSSLPVSIKPNASCAVSAAAQGQSQAQCGIASSILSSLAAKHQEGSSFGTPTVSTPQKTVFQGFSFTSTPKITEPKSEDKIKEEKPPTTTSATVPKPFSGFSLTPSKPTVASSKSPVSNVTQSIAGSQGTGFSQNKSPSFGSLAAQGQTSAAFQASGDQKGFSGAGTPIFGKTTPRRHNTSTGSDDHIEEYEPNVDFKPVIQLPELVEVKTGEEEEEKLFCERAKLFRFDKEAEQWKERGVGDIKILRHRENKSVRILMRRDQVLKLCANHKLTTDMKLTLLASSDRAWVWNAMDFAEGEMKHEKFAVKFKTADIADKFKLVFEKCQAELSSAQNEFAEEVKAESKKEESKAKDEKPDLASLFKPKAGSWSCNGCYVNNGGDVLKCPCCGTLKPGVKSEDVKTTPASGGFGGFSFGSKPSDQSSGGFKFGTPPSAPDTTAKTGSGFKFGTQSTADSKPATGPGFTFASPATTQQSSGFVFGSSGATSTQSFGTRPTAAPATTSSGGFMFGGGAATQPTQSNIFGKTTPSESKSSGVKPDSTTSSDFVFGGKPAATTASSSIFGVKSDSSTQNSSIFGAKPDSTTTSGSIFGGKSDLTTTDGTVFGGKTVTTTAAATTTAASTSIFGSKAVTTTTSSFMFGGKPVSVASSSTTGGPPNFHNLFGSSQPAKDSGFEMEQKAIEDKKVAETKEQTSGGESLLAKFLASPDSWICSSCYTNNEGMAEKCTGCEATRPDDKAPGSAATTFATAVPSVKPGNSNAAFSSGSTEAKSGSGTPFGALVAETGTDKKAGFQFGTATKATTEGFKFTFAPTSDDNKPQPAAAIGSGFNFSLSMTPLKKESPTKTPMKLSKGAEALSPKSPEVTEEGFYVNKEGDDSHIHFDPVIELPDHIEVKTGEEDEEVLFSHRAKLFRFVNGEWKERGLGDVKVLYQIDLKKARILMRREQILKLCCNHYIHPKLKMTAMPNTKGCALVWYAMDFAEGEPRSEQFSIKFKSEEVAKKFESAVEDAKERISGEIVSKPEQEPDKKTPTVETIGATVGVSDAEDDDVICTGVEEATEEEIKKARELMLPDHFYLYNRKPPCPGCRGCNDEVPVYKHTTGNADQRKEPEEYEDGEHDEDGDDDYEDVDDEEDDDDDYEDEEGNDTYFFIYYKQIIHTF